MQFSSDPELVKRITPVHLKLATYRKPTCLGSYQVTVHFHPSLAIADEEDYGDRLCFHSKPIAFEWKPRTVRNVVSDQVRMEESLGGQEEVGGTLYWLATRLIPRLLR